MKILLRSLKWLVILVLALIVSILLSWWLIPDEKLAPGAQALLARPALPPPAENAYFLIWGMRASPELDAHAVGRQIVAAHEKLIAEKGDATGSTFDSLLGKKPLTRNLSIKHCQFEKEACLYVYQKAAAQVTADLKQHAIYIERYRRLRTYPQYAERAMNFTWTTPFPDYAAVMSLSSLVDGWIAIQAASSATRKAALDELAAETALWRRLLRDSDTLLSQMIAAAALQRKLRLASEIIYTYPDAVRQYPAQMAQISAPVALADADPLRSLAGEFRFSSNFYQEISQTFDATPVQNISDRLSKFAVKAGAYRPTASINRAYAFYEERAQLFAKNPDTILQQHAALAERQTHFDWWRPSSVYYNPVGKLFVSVGQVDFSKYAFRLYDLVAFSRLLELQRRMIEADIAPERIPAAIKNVGQGLMNPYTSQPFEWDAVANTLSFAGQGERFLTNGRMLVRLTRP